MKKPIFWYSKHKELWNYLAETGRRDKYTKAKELADGEDVSGGCFACDAAHLMCTSCPLDWGAEVCLDENTLYIEWVKKDGEEHKEERKSLAKRIAELQLSEYAHELYEIK